MILLDKGDSRKNINVLLSNLYFDKGNNAIIKEIFDLNFTIPISLSFNQPIYHGEVNNITEILIRLFL